MVKDDFKDRFGPIYWLHKITAVDKRLSIQKLYRFADNAEWFTKDKIEPLTINYEVNK